MTGKFSTEDMTKTRLCKNWMHGRCFSKGDCQFAHGTQELKPYPEGYKPRKLSRVRPRRKRKTGDDCDDANREKSGQLTSSQTHPGDDSQSIDFVDLNSSSNVAYNNQIILTRHQQHHQLAQPSIPSQNSTGILYNMNNNTVMHHTDLSHHVLLHNNNPPLQQAFNQPPLPTSTSQMNLMPSHMSIHLSSQPNAPHSYVAVNQQQQPPQPSPSLLQTHFQLSSQQNLYPAHMDPHSSSQTIPSPVPPLANDSIMVLNNSVTSPLVSPLEAYLTAAAASSNQPSQPPCPPNPSDSSSSLPPPLINGQSDGFLMQHLSQPPSQQPAYTYLPSFVQSENAPLQSTLENSQPNNGNNNVNSNNSNSIYASQIPPNMISQPSSYYMVDGLNAISPTPPNPQQEPLLASSSIPSSAVAPNVTAPDGQSLAAVAAAAAAAAAAEVAYMAKEAGQEETAAATLSIAATMEHVAAVVAADRQQQAFMIHQQVRELQHQVHQLQQIQFQQQQHIHEQQQQIEQHQHQQQHQSFPTIPQVPPSQQSSSQQQPPNFSAFVPPTFMSQQVPSGTPIVPPGYINNSYLSHSTDNMHMISQPTPNSSTPTTVTGFMNTNQQQQIMHQQSALGTQTTPVVVVNPGAALGVIGNNHVLPSGMFC